MSSHKIFDKTYTDETKRQIKNHQQKQRKKRLKAFIIETMTTFIIFLFFGIIIFICGYWLGTLT